MRDPWEDPRVIAGTERMLAARRELLDGGATAIGWKLAFGTDPAKDALGLSGPVVGFLTDNTRLASGASCAVGGWTAPKLEAEIAITVGPDHEVGAVAPAIELADADAPPAELEAVLAGDIYHRAVVLGEPGPRPPGPLAVAVERGGEPVAASADAEAVVGDLEELCAYVGRYLRQFGEELAPGETIISGSAVPLLDIGAGQGWQVELAGRSEVRVEVVR